MQKLERKDFVRVERYIKNSARDLDKKLFDYYFLDGPGESVICELAKYQNSDGGFGKGLEPDFKLPNSSPLATSVAFQYLVELEVTSPEMFEMVSNMTSKAVQYLEKTFIPERAGWFAVPRRVNDFPHAPWWHWDERKKMTSIDSSWGNPSSELIGYLYKYRKFSKLAVDELLDRAIKYLSEKSEFTSFHEIFCFTRLYRLLDPNGEEARELKQKLVEAVNCLVSRDELEWESEYVAKPLDFVVDPEITFGLDDRLIEKNLDWLVSNLRNNDRIKPSWPRSLYESDLINAWDEWTAILTLKTLLKLNAFGRIER